MVERGDKTKRKSPWAPLLLAAGLALWAGAGSAAPGDVLFAREGAKEGDPLPPSIFPHWVHRIRYRCSVCHPAIFEMEQGANEVTMESINKGQFCGRCHTGKAAFDVDFQTCARCHRTPEE
jgi:c(7)-type cytochrome triheme protein